MTSQDRLIDLFTSRLETMSLAAESGDREVLEQLGIEVRDMFETLLKAYLRCGSEEVVPIVEKDYSAVKSKKGGR